MIPAIVTNRKGHSNRKRNVLLQNIDTAFRQDASRSIDHDIDLRIRDGEITEIGRGLSTENTVDCSDKIALPGLINCHSHTPNIITRGWSDDESLFPWLDANERVLEHAERSDKRASARLSAVLMLETGTTTINDMWNTYLVDELETTGIRALMGNGMGATEDTDPALVRESVEANKTFADDYQDHPTIHPTVPVHSVYRATAELLQAAHDLAAAHDLPFHIHVSETKRENENCRSEHGVTPTAWLDDLGVLDRRAVLAHGVHLTEDDRAAIDAADAGIAHCTTANLKLGSGIANVPSMNDIPVGIGTDGAASNNSLNLFREGRTAALVHKRDDPSAITAQRVLDMMTCEAAAVLGMTDTIGSLEVGKCADITLLDANDPTLRPYIGDDGLLSNLIYSFHGHADTTIVDGEIVVEDGTALVGTDTAIETIAAFHDGLNEHRDGPT